MAFILKNKTLLLLLLILAIASFFRLWQLNAIPPELYPDVAINGNDALDSIKTAPPAGGFKLFYPENNGREGLMMWLIAFSFSIFGASVWSIKIVAAIVGISTVLGLYLLAKELFNKNIALLSSFFLAVSFWHVNFSRIGFRAILVPFVLVFAFYFLFKGFRTKNLLNFLISGVFFGLGFYTYTTYRLIVLLLPLILICWWYLRKDKKLLIGTAVFLIAAFFVALPIGIYFLYHPQDFISRATGVSIFSQPNMILAFVKSLIIHLGMFNIFGDANWRHNFSGAPMLPWPVGIPFLAGIIISIKEFILSLKQKDHSKFMLHIFLLSLFLAMLLPSVLTYEGIPHALRTIGVIPVVYIFAGLGAWKVYQFLSQNAKKKKLLIFSSFFFLFAVILSGFNQYFVKWAGNPNVQGAFTKNLADIGYYLNSLPENVQKYVIVNEGGVSVPFPDGLPMPAQTPIFIERTEFGEPRTIYLKPEEISKIKNKEKAIIIYLR